MTSLDDATWYATSPDVLCDADERRRLTELARAPGSRPAGAHGEAIEAELASGAASFSFDASGSATLHAGGRSMGAGRFGIPAIAELRATLRSAPGTTKPDSGLRARLSVLEGSDVLTDIAFLQASAPDGVLFQAASQFNCLEAPGPNIVPVSEYVYDGTQGPRASVSALAGTMLRHHAAPAPDGTRFVQSDARCLDLLGDVVDPSVASVRSGYLSSNDIRDSEALARALTGGFESIRVGLHDDVEVLYGHNWNGQVLRPGARIAQVFTSTVAMGGYGRDDGSRALAEARRQLLRAAYVGTLFGAASLGKHTVVLTLIGGGVFGNPHAAIWEAIRFALVEVDPYLAAPLHVVVAARTSLAAEDRQTVAARGGFVATFRQGDVEIFGA